MTQPATCYWHSERETGLRCGNCEKPICTECMRQHPVGIRCRECGAPVGLPTHAVSVSYVTRGVLAAMGAGVGGFIALQVLFRLISFGGFFTFFIMLGLGYVLGEAVSAAVNRRRGRTYQWMALGSVALATFPFLLNALSDLSIGGLFRLAAVGVAMAVAWSRLAP